MKLTIAYIVYNENNIFFRASLKSALEIADEIIIIDGRSTDGTLELIDSFNDSRIKVIQKRYEHENIGANGKQRNEYLKYATGDFILVLDADEIIDDYGFLLKEIMKDSKFDVYNVKMVHFIENFSKVDATLAGSPQFDPTYKHYVMRRFFRNNKGFYYPETEHPILLGDMKRNEKTESFKQLSELYPAKANDSQHVGIIDNVTIYHLGYLKGQMDILKKYKNHLAKSNIHTKEFLEWWKNSRMFGFYPTKLIKPEEITSTIIKEMIKTGEV